MEQRRLRLGDILDDYCPRERRVTNHAVVAMVEEDVKQTRCTTCDAEHVYKGGKLPRRKKAEGTAKLYKQVLAGLTDDPVNPAVGAPRNADIPETAAVPEIPEMIDEPEPEPEPIEVMADVTADEMDDEPQPAVLDDGPVHRPLIRAQLPRLDGVKVERQVPDFTIRQNAGRGNFRGSNNGQRFGRGPNRGSGGGRGSGYQGFGGRQGQGQGQGQPRNKRGR